MTAQGSLVASRGRRFKWAIELSGPGGGSRWGARAKLGNRAFTPELQQRNRTWLLRYNSLKRMGSTKTAPGEPAASLPWKFLMFKRCLFHSSLYTKVWRTHERAWSNLGRCIWGSLFLWLEQECGIGSVRGCSLSFLVWFSRSRSDRGGGQGDSLYPVGYLDKQVPDTSVQETDRILVEKVQRYTCHSSS